MILDSVNDNGGSYYINFPTTPVNKQTYILSFTGNAPTITINNNGKAINQYGAITTGAITIGSGSSPKSFTWIAANKYWLETDPVGGGGGIGTNLSIGSISTTTVDIQSSTGTSATIPEATVSTAGLLNSTDKTTLSNTSGTNSGNQTFTIAGTTSPTLALSGSNTATFNGGTGITLGQTGGTITITNNSPAVVSNLAMGTPTTTTYPVTNSNGTGFSIPVATGSYAGLMSAANVTTLGSAATASSTTTFTNKKITKRVATLGNVTTITPNTDTYDIDYVANTTAGAGATLTIASDGGTTQTEGEGLYLRIATTNYMTYSWSSAANGFHAGAVPLPVNTTGGNKTDILSFYWDSINNYWIFTGISTGN